MPCWGAAKALEEVGNRLTEWTFDGSASPLVEHDDTRLCMVESAEELEGQDLGLIDPHAHRAKRFSVFILRGERSPSEKWESRKALSQYQSVAVVMTNGKVLREY